MHNEKFLKQIYNAAIRTLPLRASLSLQHLRWVGRVPDLSDPKTFNEKANWRKLRDANPLFETISDKVRVKEYVAQRLGPEWVIPTLYHGSALPARQDRDWPLPFVIKANHASGWNRFVHSAADLDWQQIEDEVSRWMSQPWHPHLGEGWYNRFPRQALVEPLIGELGQIPYDYKIFVFSGRAEFIQVDTDRFSLHKRCFYDRTWTKVDFALQYPLEGRSIPKPRHLSEMLEAAERLGKELDFVRVDFYELADRPLFGEMTLAPDCGYGRFRPARADRQLGDLWTLPSRPHKFTGS